METDVTPISLASYRAAMEALGLRQRHRPGGMRENNRAENSHLSIRRRERKQQKFKFQGSAQRFLSRHGPIYNTFNPRPHPISRPGLRTLRAKAKLAWAAATIAANRPRLAPSNGSKRLSCRFRCGGGTGRSRTTSTPRASSKLGTSPPESLAPSSGAAPDTAGISPDNGRRPTLEDGPLQSGAR